MSILLAVLFSLFAPCKPCKAKGWVLEYAIQQEVQDPHQSTCPFCNGKGWNTGPKKK